MALARPHSFRSFLFDLETRGGPFLVVGGAHVGGLKDQAIHQRFIARHLDRFFESIVKLGHDERVRSLGSDQTHGVVSTML